VLRVLSINGATCQKLILDVSDAGIIGRGCYIMKGGERVGFGLMGWQ